MRRKILATAFVLLSLLVVLAGCNAGDPLSENFYSSASYIRLAEDGSGGYWHVRLLDATNLATGASGATLVPPGASTLGGHRLDALTEYLYFDVAVLYDYDGVSDAQVRMFFEVDEDNSGGLLTDAVVIHLVFWCKQLGERTTTFQEYNIPVVVGLAEPHDLFEAVLNCPPTSFSVIAFRVNLDTVNSDVDSIILNYVQLRYPSFTPGLERE